MDGLPCSACAPGHARATPQAQRSDANGLQTARALQSRVLSFVSKTKESPTSSCFTISGLLPVLSSFGTYLWLSEFVMVCFLSLAFRICHGLVLFFFFFTFNFHFPSSLKPEVTHTLFIDK